MAKKPQLWSGRFKEPVDEQVKRFTASVGFDKRLAKQDIRGSLAHARMLAACGILSRRDLTAIERGLARVGREDRKSTRLNSSHSQISYAVFCLKKKKTQGRFSLMTLSLTMSVT